MKKRPIKVMFKMPMVIVFIFILIFFTPLAIYSPGENRNRGVVTAIGIDKADEQYEISLLTFIPTANQTYKEQNAVISGKGQSVAEAIYNAQIAMGRTIGLAHAKTTVVNEELLNEDISVVVNYLSRVASLPENTVFVCTNKTAKEMLESSQELTSHLGLKLEQVIGYNAKHLYVTDTSLEAFYKGYYSKTKASLIGYLTLEEATEQGKEKSSVSGMNEPSQGGGQSESQGGGQGGSGGEKKHILNQGQAVLLKDGKKVALLSIEELNGINLLNTKSKDQIISIDNVEHNGNKLSMQYKIKNKKTLITTEFENGYPIYVAQLILGVELVEVSGMDDSLKINTEFSEVTDEVARKIEEEIKKQYTASIKILRENNADVIGVTKKFFIEHRKEFTKFVEQLDGIDDFLNYVTFKLNTIVQPD